MPNVSTIFKEKQAPEKVHLAPELLRGREVAKLLGVSVALAYRWMQDGTLPVVRVGRTVRVPRLACLRWIEQRTQQPTGGAAA